VQRLVLESQAVPLGQSASRKQTAVHSPAVVLQRPLAHSVSVVHAEQVGCGQAQWPAAVSQASEPQSALLVQAWTQRCVLASQLLLAQSELLEQVPHAATLVLLQTQAPDVHAWPPHCALERQAPVQTWLVASHTPLAQSESRTQGAQLATDDGVVQSHTCVAVSQAKRPQSELLVHAPPHDDAVVPPELPAAPVVPAPDPPVEVAPPPAVPLVPLAWVEPLEPAPALVEPEPDAEPVAPAEPEVVPLEAPAEDAPEVVAALAPTAFFVPHPAVASEIAATSIHALRCMNPPRAGWTLTRIGPQPRRSFTAAPIDHAFPSTRKFPLSRRH
jgi:hypothetical protein